MTGSARRAAALFRRKYKILEPNCACIEDILCRQGYTLIEYDSTCSDSDVRNIVDSLGLGSYIQSSRGFTYSDDNNRLIFINDELLEDERLLVLAHEEAHIFCGHMSTRPVFGSDVTQEYEANEFVHWLLNPTAVQRAGAFTANHRKALSIIAVGVAALLITILIIPAAVSGQSGSTTRSGGYSTGFFVTDHGEKYHRRDCVAIRNSDSVRQMTEEEYDSGEYEPCELCLPED